jgi:PhnB protein
MQVNTYLFFDGSCGPAFKFYEQCFGGKIEMMMTYGESPTPDQTPPGWRDKIMHVRLAVGNGILMGSDAPPERYQAKQGFSVSLSVDTPAEADRVFNALAESGTVRMPLEKTFWATRFGMVVDRFGVPWMVNCE